MPDPSSKLTWYIVHYGASEVTNRMLRSLALQTRMEGVEIVVIDNGSNFERSREVARLDLRVETPHCNLGYLRSAAWARGQRRHDPNWTIVSNNDLTVDARFCERLMGTDDDALLVAPDVWTPDGRRLNPFLTCRPSPQAMRAKRALVFSSAPILLAYSLLSGLFKRWRRPPALPLESEMYAPHGSCLVFREAFFEAGGILDHFAFLYLEEVFIAEQVRRMDKGKIRFRPDLQLLHDEHTATGRVKWGAANRHHRAAFSEAVYRYF